MKELRPAVEVEEVVCSYEPPDNGSGPLWCYGSPLLVRTDAGVFVCVPETGRDAMPLCNTRWCLYRRDASGWERIHAGSRYDEREPCPLVQLPGRGLYLSVNPAHDPGVERGPCHPRLLESPESALEDDPNPIEPRWLGDPAFTEHSYRGIGVDGDRGEILLLNIEGSTSVQHWAFRDAGGEWSRQGGIEFQIRGCYPQVAMREQAGHILAIGDIVEPVEAWREHKYEQTGRDWDYVFRRLFYTWTPDITREAFCSPLEIDNVEATAGHITNLDLHVDASGAAHILYLRRTVAQELIRERFFPHHTCVVSLEYVALASGKIVEQRQLLWADGAPPGLTPSYGRFHTTPDGGLLVVYAATEAGDGTVGNYVMRLDGDAPPARLELESPFRTFFTATERGGSPPSHLLDLYGVCGPGNTVRYARVSLAE
ncbi:MAG: hypothetical protein QGI83_17370 [Candidatus Latescibacteria bacterium]|jgi:hypothetical protein|nr:hypothetical protein [Candidatus Latescibacterota bacterium]